MMTNAELVKFLDEWRAKGLSDDNIAKIMTLAFIDGKLTRRDYDSILGYLGFFPDEKVKKMSDEEVREMLRKQFEGVRRKK